MKEKSSLPNSVKKTSSTRKVLYILIVLIALMLVLNILATSFAWFTDTKPSNNMAITTGSIDISASFVNSSTETSMSNQNVTFESNLLMAGSSFEKIIAIKNTGKNECYARFYSSLLLNGASSDKISISSSKLIGTVPTGGELKKDSSNRYYFNKTVSPNSYLYVEITISVDESFGNPEKNQNVEFDVNIESCQSEGVSLFDSKGNPIPNNWVSN